MPARAYKCFPLQVDQEFSLVMIIFMLLIPVIIKILPFMILHLAFYFVESNFTLILWEYFSFFLWEYFLPDMIVHKNKLIWASISDENLV